MPKLTKSESARINGAKSRGPVTPQGLAKSSMNATTHGLTARTAILGNESQDLFTEMLNAYFEHLRPANPVEIDLVSEMVSARWRLRRVWRYETAILDIEMDAQAPDFEKRFETFDEDMRGALAFTRLVDTSKGLATTLRFDIYLSRTYCRLLRVLRELQNEPTEPPKSPLNGENRGLSGAP